MMPNMPGDRHPFVHRPGESGRRCWWSEEAAAGLALGTLDPDVSREYRRHLAACAECAGLVREWEELLRRQPAEAQQTIVPPPRLKRRVMRSAALFGMRRWFQSRSRMFVTAAAAIMLLIGAAAVWHLSVTAPAGEARERTAIIQTPENGVPVFLEPVYRQYYARGELVLQGAGADADGYAPAVMTNGYVWLNDRGDLFIFLDGVVPRADADYQVWSVLGDRMENVGILIQKDRMAYLYVQGTDPSGWEAIAVSLEPRGGSMLPTGPEAITVRFR